MSTWMIKQNTKTFQKHSLSDGQNKIYISEDRYLIAMSVKEWAAICISELLAVDVRSPELNGPITQSVIGLKMTSDGEAKNLMRCKPESQKFQSSIFTSDRRDILSVMGDT